MLVKLVPYCHVPAYVLEKYLPQGLIFIFPQQRPGTFSDPLDVVLQPPRSDFHRYQSPRSVRQYIVNNFFIPVPFRSSVILDLLRVDEPFGSDPVQDLPMSGRRVINRMFDRQQDAYGDSQSQNERDEDQPVVMVEVRRRYVCHVRVLSVGHLCSTTNRCCGLVTWPRSHGGAHVCPARPTRRH